MPEKCREKKELYEQDLFVIIKTLPIIQTGHGRQRSWGITEKCTALLRALWRNFFRGMGFYAERIEKHI